MSLTAGREDAVEVEVDGCWEVSAGGGAVGGASAEGW